MKAELLARTRIFLFATVSILTLWSSQSPEQMVLGFFPGERGKESKSTKE
jgi:hypothetical protein